MKALSVAGTAAMFLVGGGILTHGIPALHHAIEGATAELGGALRSLAAMSVDAVIGIVAGALTLALVTAALRLRGKRTVTPA